MSRNCKARVYIHKRDSLIFIHFGITVYMFTGIYLLHHAMKHGKRQADRLTFDYQLYASFSFILWALWDHHTGMINGYTRYNLRKSLHVLPVCIINEGHVNNLFSFVFLRVRAILYSAYPPLSSQPPHSNLVSIRIKAHDLKIENVSSVVTIT